MSVEFNYTAELGTVPKPGFAGVWRSIGWPPACLPLDKGKARGSDAFANFVEGVSSGITAYQKFPVPNKWNRMVQWLFILCGPYAVVAGLDRVSGKSTAWMMTEPSTTHKDLGRPRKSVTSI